MIDITSAQFSLFFVAALVLAFTPGASITYVVARTAAGGQEAGMRSAAGTAVGGMVHVVAAALGLSILISESALLFSLVKYLGAAYLVFLGIKLLFTQATIDLDSPLDPLSHAKLFWEGFTVEALNVKTALFFLAFIPQFIDPAGAITQQFIFYGLICVVLNTSADVMAVLSARLVLAKLKSAQCVNRMSGTVLVGLGAWVATHDQR